jgi:hypothetical protein
MALLALLLMLGLFTGGLALYPSGASATEGLPPGLPVPSWAANKPVHFLPPANARSKESTLGGSSGGISPQLAGQKGETIKYHGGPVQTAPELYLLFWGNNFFNNTPPVTLYTQLKEFYYGLGGELDNPGENSWQGILTQYTNAKGPYTFAKVVGETNVTNVGAPKNLTLAQVLEEITLWSGAHQNANTQMIVLTAPGTTFSSSYQHYCGYHSVDDQGYSYTLVPYNESECDVEASPVHETTGAASHEFAESTTDPNASSGWLSESGEEIADLCEKYPAEELPEKNGRQGFWWVVKLWDDEGGNRCSLEDPPYPTPSSPTVATEGATEIQYRQATIAGSVNPNGLETHYHFEYGTTTGYGSSTPEGEVSYSAGNTGESTTLIGLKPGTTYDYRIVASSWVGTSYGANHEFTTPIPPPAVKTEAPTEVGETHAVLNAEVNPEEFSTTYQIEYWQNGKSNEIKKIPATAESVGSGTSYVKVSQHLTGLPKSTEYIYRITATSAGGTTKGREVTFVTGPLLEVQTTPNPGGSQESSLKSVSCSSSTACVAVGSYKSSTGSTEMLAENWTGTEWQLKAIPTPSGAKLLTVGAVSCSSSTECTAVGYYESSTSTWSLLAERWNGTEWQIQSVPRPGGKELVELTGVSCASSTSCEAVGSLVTGAFEASPLAEVWNGTEWKIQTTPHSGANDGLLSVSCTSASACTAVGTQHAEVLIQRWNGTEWSIQKGVSVSTGEINYLDGVSCTTATACTAVGNYREALAGPSSELAESWNGTEWTRQTLPTPSGAKETLLEGVSCSSSTACISAGTYVNNAGVKVPLADISNGSEWKIHASATPVGAKSSGLNRIACSSQFCVAAGQYENSSGVLVTLAEATGSPIAITEAASGITNIAAVLNGTVNPSGGETTYHFEYGKTNSYGTVIPEPSANVKLEAAPEKVAYTVTGLQPETTYHYRVVGTNSAGTADGSDQTFTTPRAWSILSSPNPSGATESVLKGVSCASSTSCFGVGYDKSSSGYLEALGENWTGTEWKLSPMVTPSGAKSILNIEAVSCTSSSACTVVGNYANSSGASELLAERWNGTEWKIQAVPNPNSKAYVELNGVSCVSSTSCEAVGTAVTGVLESTNIAEIWNGTEWKIQTTPNPETEDGFLSVSCTSASACTAVGLGSKEVLIEQWNGTEWKTQKGVSISGAYVQYLHGVSCASATACTAVGSYREKSTGPYADFAESWNGTAWSRQTLPTPSGAKETFLEGVSCSSSTSCIATGSYANSAGTKTVLSEGWNGTEWAVQVTSIPTGAKANGFSGATCIAKWCVTTGQYQNSSGTTVTLIEASGPPVAETEAATNVASTGATLNAFVTPDGWATTYHLEYGLSMSYGTTIPIPDMSLTSETTAEAVKQTVTGLQPGTTYHYRVVATNGAGVTDGTDHTLSTTPGTWSIVSSPNPSGATENVLKGVSCSSSTSCFGVGSYKNSAGNPEVLGESWNGIEWKLSSMPTPSGVKSILNVEAVSCSSATACTAVGNYENSSGVTELLAERWNGTEWKLQTVPNPNNKAYVEFNGVSCTSSTSCEAVGTAVPGAFEYKTIAESWNGTEWKIQTTLDPETEDGFLSVSCTASSACTATGESSQGMLIEQWNGTEWKAEKGVSVSGAYLQYLHGVSCASATACTAVGSYREKSTGPYADFAESWNGTEWSRQTLPTPSGAKETFLEDVSCSSSTSCIATGTYVSSSGTKLTLGDLWNGTEWLLISTPNPTGATSSDLSGLSCASSSECTAVGHYVNSSGTTVTLAESDP